MTHSPLLNELPEQVTAGLGELALRLHYPAWCEEHALSAALDGFEDNTWWRLFGLPSKPFDRAVRRVELTLVFAAHTRLRLMRRKGDNLDDVRWALGRAPFVPEGISHALRDADLLATAASHAALSLSWCLLDSPDLCARLRLRFSPLELRSADDLLRSRLGDSDSRNWLAALWGGSVRVAYKENTS